MLSNITILIILILINAYFAATEIAFISLNDSKIEKQAKEGNKKAKQISKMLKSPSKFLATIQIGVTLAGFLSSAFAADTFANIFADSLNGIFPVIGIETLRTFSIVFITIILSFFTLIFGELVPKRLAMKHYEKVSYGTIGAIRIISIIAAPFVKLLTISTNFISKLFGVNEQDEEIVTEEEIRMMVDEGEEKGTIEREEKEMINNIFEFNDRVASEVMIHRTDIFAIDMNADLKESLSQLDEYKYSRIPVYEDTIDDIKGVLYIKDLIQNLTLGKEIKLKELLRNAYFVSESKPIDELFRELQKNKNHMAIVVDEYGGTAGLITLEDMIEEVFGNIFDEYDDEELDYEKIDENTYMINGSVTIYELNKVLGVNVPEGDYDTLSGYLIEQLGRIPLDEEKPTIETKEVTYKIEEYEDKRIVKVKACKNKAVDVDEKDVSEADM